MPRDSENGIKTFAGRVVYERKKHLFKWRDVQRLAKGVEMPISRAEVLDALDTLTIVMNQLLALPFFPFVMEAEPVFAKLESLEYEFETFLEQMREKGIDSRPPDDETQRPWWENWFVGFKNPLEP